MSRDLLYSPLSAVYDNKCTEHHVNDVLSDNIVKQVNPNLLRGAKS